MLYLIKSGNYTKIGYTTNLEKRLENYDCMNPNYKLLGVKEGDFKDESNYHKKYTPYTVKGEWMLLPKEILDPLKEEFNNIEMLKTTCNRRLNLEDFNKYEFNPYLETGFEYNTIPSLNMTAVKVLYYIEQSTTFKFNHVYVSQEVWMLRCGFKTRKSLRDGITFLLKNKVLARSQSSNMYWINPYYKQVGNRIRFHKKYKTKSNETIQINI